MNHTSCQFRDKHTVGGIVFYKHAFLVIPGIVLSIKQAENPAIKAGLARNIGIMLSS